MMPIAFDCPDKNPVRSFRQLAMPLALVLMAIALMLASLARYSATAMDELHLTNQRQAIDNAISQRLNRMLREQMSVAWWDDLVVKTAPKTFDRPWLDVSIGRFLQSSYDHDVILILDEENSLIYSYLKDKSLSKSQTKAIMNAIAPLLQQSRGGRNHSPRITDLHILRGSLNWSTFTEEKVGRSAGALAQVGDKPMLAAVMSIVPDKRADLLSHRPRLLVSLIEVDNDLLNRIGADVMLPSLRFQSSEKDWEGVFQLKADDGAPVTPLVWHTHLPGQDLLQRLTPPGLLALGTAYAMIAALAAYLHRTNARLAQREEDSRHLANHDPLTGLPNRRHLEAELKRRKKGPFDAANHLACAVIDLDRFKDINDTLGHAAGDALIQCVGQRLVEGLRPNDFIARLGGDEIAIVRPCRGRACADDLARRIHSAFAAHFMIMGHDIETNVSIGIATAKNAAAVDDLLKEADIALYEAKASGKGIAIHFAPEMAQKVERRRQLEIELKAAIANRALTLVYQPVVEAATGGITSVEALVRWTSEQHGPVPPDIFISIAEETGLMASLGRIVIEQAMADSRRWPNITTSINISPAQLRSASIIADLVGPAARLGISPDCIMLEITESVLLANDRRTRQVLDELKVRGFGLSLDDFGTGYSSLAYVRDFPFDILKIDRSFVRGQGDTEKSVEIIHAVVNFGRILGRDVVAEGVETEHEMHAMLRAGVTHLQGYLFSTPLSADHIEAIVAINTRPLAAASTIPAKATQRKRPANP